MAVDPAQDAESNASKWACLIVLSPRIRWGYDRGRLAPDGVLESSSRRPTVRLVLPDSLYQGIDPGKGRGVKCEWAYPSVNGASQTTSCWKSCHS